ncbi:phospholipase D/nuclease [Stipitochalara longipes BDJ]|nr:phospholipase D/nuclease [Stipitochalara longipes BDJ]
MSDAESDEDLRMAIALSLMSPEPMARKDIAKPPSNKPIISARTDANETSLTSSVYQDLSTPKHFLPGTQDEPRPISVGLLGLDRGRMENERLERAALRKRGEESASARKRKASTSPAPSHDRAQMSRPENVSKPSHITSTKREPKNLPHPASILIQKGFPGLKAGSDAPETGNASLQKPTILPLGSGPETAGIASKKPQHPFHRGQFGALGQSGLQYPDGIVKKTWAFGYDRNGDDIKIEEVLQKNDLEVAVLSSFQVDADWVISKLDEKTKVVWVLQAKDNAQKRNWASNAPKSFRFCFPSMDGIVNCMHAKLMLLAHKTHLRVVIPSANLTPYDWGETGCLENVCFLIDLPRLPDKTDLEILTPFGKELLLFLRAMGISEAQINSMKRFDFSKTAQFAFVHSIGGSHIGRQKFTTGLCSLGKAIRDLELNTEDALNIDFLAASIGNLNEDFLKSIYLAAKGDDGLTEYEWRAQRPTKKKGIDSEVEDRVTDEVFSRCRIYFPSRETVQLSKGGTDGAGTICFQPKFWASSTFPRALMRDCKSQRKGLLMHSKMIFVRLDSANLRGDVAWAYVGSHNLSESAWGRLVKDNTTKKPKMNIRNWECGVVIPVPAQPTTAMTDGRDDFASGPDMSVFDGRLPVPMIVPGEEYQNRTPWFFST